MSRPKPELESSKKSSYYLSIMGYIFMLKVSQSRVFKCQIPLFLPLILCLTNRLLPILLLTHSVAKAEPQSN